MFRSNRKTAQKRPFCKPCKRVNFHHYPLIISKIITTSATVVGEENIEQTPVTRFKRGKDPFYCCLHCSLRHSRQRRDCMEKKMPRGKKLTGFQQGQIQAWGKEGISQSEIAKRVGKSRKAVQTFLKTPIAYNETHAGRRPPKMSPADSRRLLREASKGDKSAGTLTTELELPISKRRAQQIISASPLLKYRKAKITPSLTPMHREKRLQWARERAG